jgi:hypothetical protein
MRPTGQPKTRKSCLPTTMAKSRSISTAIKRCRLGNTISWWNWRTFCQYGCEFLEVGLGLGISALRIAQHIPRPNTLTERPAKPVIV